MVVVAFSFKEAMAAVMAVSAVGFEAESAVTASDHRFRRLFLPASWASVEDPGALVRVLTKCLLYEWTYLAECRSQ